MKKLKKTLGIVSLALLVVFGGFTSSAMAAGNVKDTQYNFKFHKNSTSMTGTRTKYDHTSAYMKVKTFAVVTLGLMLV